MGYRRRSAGPGWSIVFGIFMLIVGVVLLVQYANAQADAQSKQQQLDSGTVMCGDQQMQQGDSCDQYYSYSSSNNDPGLYGGSQSYDGQQQADQQSIDNEKSSSNQQLFGGLVCGGVGLLSLIVGIRGVAKQSD